MSDPAKYRKREEVDKVRDETDPIKLLEARLIERGILDATEAKKQRDLIKEEIEQAVDFALDAALPPESELMVDILADNTEIGGAQNGR